MWIRRKTLERLLSDQQRTHQADRRELLQVIATQNDRLMFLAGRTWDMPPHTDSSVWDEPVDEPSYDPGDLPDDLGTDPV